LGTERGSPETTGFALRVVYFIRSTIKAVWYFVIAAAILWKLSEPHQFSILDWFYDGGGLVLGAFIFILGFTKFRELRLIEDTPVEAVKSISMGRVHVQGKATGDECLTSLFTRTRCFYYDATIERYEYKDRAKVWKTIREDCYYHSFYVDDGTGRVKVDPKGAEFEAAKTLFAEFEFSRIKKSNIDPSLGIPAPMKELADNFVHGDSPYRLTEYCIIAGHEANVIGTCSENPEPAGEHDRNLIAKGDKESTFLITASAERQEERRLRRTALVRIALGASIMLASCAVALSALGYFQPPPPHPQMLGTVAVLLNTFDEGPEPISTPAPLYPPVAKEKGIKGDVWLKAVVGTDGTIKHVELEKDTDGQTALLKPHPLLVSSILKVLPRWRYKPAYFEGKPEEVEIPIEIEFALRPAK
jgi:Gram-negative bacterial TonB protein C-terminal/E3 Ubiquitin ligase